ncbi:hypothetical protein [Companilactobacillus insicii]|uniref:hypothetical protein n=1 Tax=Companilactobacillus insicii TaxID=1732567 RepID=UPI000F7A3C76|nr:hypothetical protein [Companilactobacillus insicii]
MKMVNYLRIWCGIILVITIGAVLFKGFDSQFSLFMFFLCALFASLTGYLLRKEKNKKST